MLRLVGRGVIFAVITCCAKNDGSRQNQGPEASIESIGAKYFRDSKSLVLSGVLKHSEGEREFFYFSGERKPLSPLQSPVGDQQVFLQCEQDSCDRATVQLTLTRLSRSTPVELHFFEIQNATPAVTAPETSATPFSVVWTELLEAGVTTGSSSAIEITSGAQAFHSLTLVGSESSQTRWLQIDSTPGQTRMATNYETTLSGSPVFTLSQQTGSILLKSKSLWSVELPGARGEVLLKAD